jgi:SAM-dependent methyltransferase
LRLRDHRDRRAGAPLAGSTPTDDYAPHARFYDLEHEDYQEDIAAYAGFAARAGRTGILEMACGSGRVLLPLAASGYTVTGVDLSPAMLAIARQKVKAAQLEKRVTLIQGDMRTVDLGRQFDLVIIGLNSLMHLETQQAQLDAFRNAARHLSPQGRLVVDLFNPDVALPESPQEGQLFLHCLKVLPETEGGAHLLHFQSPRVDRATQLVTMTNYYDELPPDGHVRRHMAPFTLRYVTAGELRLLLERAGLEVEALYGTYELDPLREDSPRLLAVAAPPTPPAR